MPITRTDVHIHFLPDYHRERWSPQAIMVLEEDTWVNPIGIKRVGEIGAIDVNAAIADVLHHAIDVGVRKLPVRINDLLTGKFLA